MKTLVTLSLTFLVFLFASCSSDDNTTDETNLNNSNIEQQENLDNFPVKLVLKEKTDGIVFYKEGKKTTPTKEELNIFFDANNEKIARYDTNIRNASYEFLNDKLLNYSSVFDSENKQTVEYYFNNGILNIIDSNKEAEAIVPGSIQELKVTIIFTYSIRDFGGGSNTTVSNVILSPVTNPNLMPLTFESTFNKHSYSSIEEIKGDNTLYLFSRAYVFRKE